MTTTIADLVTEAKAAGVRDAYEFAEWLTQVKEYWGSAWDLDEHDAESCYIEAQGWWEGHHGRRT